MAGPIPQALREIFVKIKDLVDATYDQTILIRQAEVYAKRIRTLVNDIYQSSWFFDNNGRHNVQTVRAMELMGFSIKEITIKGSIYPVICYGPIEIVLFFPFQHH